jgi:hypothetical protein
VGLQTWLWEQWKSRIYHTSSVIIIVLQWASCDVYSFVSLYKLKHQVHIYTFLSSNYISKKIEGPGCKKLQYNFFLCIVQGLTVIGFICHYWLQRPFGI